MTERSPEQSLWQVPAYLPYLQPVLSEQVVAQAESDLGVKLPRALLELLAEQNGGYVSRRLPDSVHSMVWGIGPHFPSLTGRPWWEGIDADTLPWLPSYQKLLAFDGDGHWHLCLDYRRMSSEGQPSVSFIDLECETDEVVAADFQSFLDLLTSEEEASAFGLKGIDIGDAAATLERALKGTFGPPDTFDQGYPVYRMQLQKVRTSKRRRGKKRSNESPEWLWLSPNEVSRGFVRKSDPRHKELSGMLPGMALRKPEMPEVTVLLSFTEGIASRVKKALVDLELDFVALRRGSGDL